MSPRPGSSPETEAEKVGGHKLPEHLSPSQINGLLMCAEQYRLTRVVRVPERPMWASIGGSTVHLLTEKHDRAAYAEGRA